MMNKVLCDKIFNVEYPENDDKMKSK